MDPQTKYTFLGIGAALAVIVFGLGFAWLVHTRENEILNKWARETGLTILRKKRVSIFTAPFNWAWSGSGQVICRLLVRDRENRERSVWLRLGGKFGGLWFNDEVEVKWEEQEPG